MGCYDATDALRARENEKSIYRAEILSFPNRRSSGHYTQYSMEEYQAAWLRKSRGRGNVTIVYNYDPPGNVMGQKPH